MAYTTPKTFTAGSVLTASEMNTYVSDNTGCFSCAVFALRSHTTLTSTAGWGQFQHYR